MSFCVHTCRSKKGMQTSWRYDSKEFLLCHALLHCTEQCFIVLLLLLFPVSFGQLNKTFSSTMHLLSVCFIREFYHMQESSIQHMAAAVTMCYSPTHIVHCSLVLSKGHRKSYTRWICYGYCQELEIFEGQSFWNTSYQHFSKWIFVVYSRNWILRFFEGRSKSLKTFKFLCLENFQPHNMLVWHTV